MLERLPNDKVMPKILEFNFNADCSRVAQIYPQFYEEILNATYCNNFTNLDYIDLTNL